MDDKPERPRGGEPDLAAALRRARIENAERAEAVAELREIELGRLALLESALQKVVRQAPPGVDLFDLTLARGDRPRVFLDMVAFIEMARDRRTYRFFQDTLYGRVLIAESPKIETIVAACTNYVARRLVERERALVAPGIADATSRSARTRRTTRSGLHAPLGGPPRPARPAARPARTQAVRAARRRGASSSPRSRRSLMALGAITLVGLLAARGLARRGPIGSARRWSRVARRALLLRRAGAALICPPSTHDNSRSAPAAVVRPGAQGTAGGTAWTPHSFPISSPRSPSADARC